MSIYVERYYIKVFYVNNYHTQWGINYFKDKSKLKGMIAHVQALSDIWILERFYKNLNEKI